jgi:23S rRNA (cytidine1920-2'-O)/16S rRNA (cytidine1409-2'-O)-methyltransferase
MEKKRLDSILVEKGFVNSKEKAKALILSGNVFVNEHKITKAGTKFTGKEVFFIKEPLKYVSRGGYKLEHALKEFNINVSEKKAIDIGASTGGFTDCLLQHNIKKVYAVDVGYGQIDYKLRKNSKVIVIERCNFRYIDKEKVPEKVDIIVIDVSFISLKLIIPNAIQFLKPAGEIVALIKPQFEVGKGEVGKGGIVRDTYYHDKIIKELKIFFNSINLQTKGLTESPILGQKGNKEFLIYLKTTMD